METIDDYPGKRSTQATTVVSETERVLSKLCHGYKRAKAQQILRLLKDQESLNQRFRDCALDDDNSDDDDHGNAGSDGQDSLAGNVGDAPAERKTATRRTNTNDASRKVVTKVDLSRCRTSMGFYNEAECSGSVDGDDAGDIGDFEAETDAAILEDCEAMLGQFPNENTFANGKSRRLFRLQLDEPEPIPEEDTHQSARSSRPKTGLVTNSAKSKQYRRPSQQTDSSARSTKNPTITTSVSKLEGSITPRGGARGFGENAQEGLFQLTPRFNDMGGSFTPRVDDISQCFTPRAYDGAGHSRRQYNDLPAYLTPRTNDYNASLTGRQKEPSRHTDILATPRTSSNQHRAVLNFYNGQVTPRDDFVQYVASPRFDEQSGIVTPRSYHTLKQGRGLDKSLYESASQPLQESSKSKRQGVKNGASNNSGSRMPLTPRSMLSVDQSPIHVIPTGCPDGEMTPRRQKNEPKPKKRADLQRTGAHKNLSKLSERVHPINVMKLPPLEVTISKPVIF